MYIPKKYGQSKIDRCPFCQKQATTMNRQKVPVCSSHKEEHLGDLKCACGSTLDILHGKFGIFFSCIKCGNMSLKKVLELNTIKPKIRNENTSYSQKVNPQNRKETMVRSDDPGYFD